MSTNEDLIKVKVKAIEEGSRIVELDSKREKRKMNKSIVVKPGEVFELDVVPLEDGSPRIPKWCELVEVLGKPEAEADDSARLTATEAVAKEEAPKPAKKKAAKKKAAPKAKENKEETSAE